MEGGDLLEVGIGEVDRLARDGRSLKPRRKRVGAINKFIIIVPLIAILISVILIFGGGSNEDETNYAVVKVLIYSGYNTDSNSITQMEDSIDQANNAHLVPGVKFTYNTSDVIDNKTLQGYDVVIMGGSSNGFQYIDNDDIDVDDLEDFVESGKGFVGICAGAYSAASYTYEWYEGWGLAPDILNLPYVSEGNLTIQSTTEGEGIMNVTDRTISHVNGPAMYTSSSDVVTFATYGSTNADYPGYAAIMGERYGEGHVLLSGVHPELAPQQVDLFINFIMWAYNGTYINETNNTTD